MARLPRLALANHTHLVLQRAHSGLVMAGRPLFSDEADRDQYRTALFETAAAEAVAVQAYALCAQEVWLLLHPATAQGPSRLMQALGRRYVSAHHRRHGGSGTLWDGRFRAAVVEPGAPRLAALRWVDSAPELGSNPPLPRDVATDGAAGAPGGWSHSSASQRLGAPRHAALQDPPEWWSLGNTPFEREAVYRSLLRQDLPPDQAAALRQATTGGWVLGSATFAEQVARAAGRATRPRPRGRPPRTAAG